MGVTVGGESVPRRFLYEPYDKLYKLVRVLKAGKDEMPENIAKRVAVLSIAPNGMEVPGIGFHTCLAYYLRAD